MPHTHARPAMGVLRRALYKLAVRSRKTRRFVRDWGPVDVRVQGLKMRLHPTDNTTERLIWLRGHMPEHRSLRALEALVSEGTGLFVDIGGNAGAFTVPMARALPKGRVIALEPNPTMAQRLRANLMLNDLSADVLETAVGDAPGTATLRFNSHNFGEASLKVQNQNGGIDVPVAPLNALLPDNIPRPFVMKIDIEGFEDRALIPFFDTAPNHRWPDAILIETAHTSDWDADLLGVLHAKGYVPGFEGDGNTLYILDKSHAPA